MLALSDRVDRACAQVAIPNRQGLHARPVMRFVDLASTFAADIMVDKGDGTEQVSGKDPMQMMLLAAPRGTTLRILAVGTDADQAVGALLDLVRSGFGED